jgi:hypothetical protein
MLQFDAYLDSPYFVPAAVNGGGSAWGVGSGAAWFGAGTRKTACFD